MKAIVLFIIANLIASNDGAGQITCRSDPTTDQEDNAVDDGDRFTLSCDLQGQGNSVNDHIDFCGWTHFEPLNEQQGKNYVPDIDCGYAASSQGSSNCNTDSRITGQVSQTTCSIQVSNSKPEDTGTWTASVSTRSSSSKQDIQIYLYTYNQSQVEILDENDNRDGVSSVSTTYNWNDKQEDWEKDGPSNFERVELTCYAAGGRPQPTFTWQINGDDLPDDDIFDNPAAGQSPNGDLSRSYGQNGEIQDRETTLQFEVSTDLINVLQDRYNIDTNPENGDFDFDIDCIVEQNSIETAKETVRIDVQKSYDDGHLKGTTIGMIVGIVIAVIILVAAIALLIFAKSSAIWCFADDERTYKDPQTSRPRGPGPQRGPQQPQVHNRGAIDRLEPAVVPATTKLSYNSPNNSKPPISSRRSSSSSSGNIKDQISANAGVNASLPRQQGEWLGQQHDYPSSNPPIIKTHKQPSKRSTTSGHSTGSSSSNNMTNNIPPARPPKSAELQYASLDKKFMDNPRNQVLPTVINVNSPAGTIANPSYRPTSSTSPYATIVSSSIRSSEQRVNGEVVSSTMHREEYHN